MKEIYMSAHYKKIQIWNVKGVCFDNSNVF